MRNRIQFPHEQLKRLDVRKGGRPIDGTYLEHYFRYLFAADFANSKTVLDCACGSGYGAFLLGKGAKGVLGVDNDTQALEIANADWCAPNVCYRLLDVRDLHALGQSFDVIVSFETIEHLVEPREFLEAATACVNPGGLLIVSTPNKAVYREGLAPNPFHVREFTKREFLQMIPDSFKRIDVYGQIEVLPGTASRPPSVLRSMLAGALASRAVGHTLYVRRMRKRFMVVPAKDPDRYMYFVAVCHK